MLINEEEKLLGEPDGAEEGKVHEHGHGLNSGTIWGSTFNTCNSAIGAGILSLPYAVQQVGLGLGLITMVSMCILLGITMKILVWAARLTPTATSYELLVKSFFGQKVSLIVNICVIIGSFGACVAFLVVVADLLPPLVALIISHPYWIHSRAAVAIGVSIIGIIPLSCLKHFNSLRFSSTLAIISVTFTVFVVIFRSSELLPLSPTKQSQLVLFNFDMGIFDSVPLIGFAFGCHLQFLAIYSELKDRHIPSRSNKVIIFNNLICFVLYALTGVFGYLQFPGTVKGNILTNYSDTDALVNVARGVLSFVIVCHYPPSNYVCRAALDHLFFPNAKPSDIRRVLWTIIIWIGALIISLAVPEVNVVFGLLGASINSMIVFILPALFLIYASGNSDWDGWKGKFASIFAWAVVAFGVIISIVGTIVVIMKQWFPTHVPF